MGIYFAPTIYKEVAKKMPQQNSEVELNPQKVGSAVKAQWARSDFLQKNRSKRNKACSDMAYPTDLDDMRFFEKSA